MENQNKSVDKRPSKIIKIEEIDNNQQLRKPYKHQGNYRIIQNKDSTKKISCQQTIEISKKTEIFSLKYNSDDQILAAGCSDGSIKIFNEKGLQTAQFQGSQNHSSTPCTSVRWKPKQNTTDIQTLLSVSSDGSIVSWSPQTGKQLHRFIENKGHTIMALDYNKSGNLFATAGKDFQIRIYDDNTKNIIQEFTEGSWNNPGHSNRIFALKFLPDNENLLMSCGWDSNLHIWDVRSGKNVGHFYGPKVSGDSIDYRNGTILTGSYRNKEQLQLWDFNKRTLIKNIDWDPYIFIENVYIYSAQFSKFNNDTIVATTGGINEVRIFDQYQNHKPCATVTDLYDSIYAVDYANKQDKFAFAGNEGNIYVMKIN